MDKLKSNLYSFFFDFRGGMYINQVTAIDENKARFKWAIGLDYNKIKYFGPALKVELIQELKSEELIKICGVKNVWIFNVMLKGHFSTIHMIKTTNL